MSAEETEILVSLSRLNNIDKLKGPSNYHIWKEQFEDELKLMGIWRYIAKDYNPPVVGGTVTAESLKAWEQAHKRICAMFRTRCGSYARSLIESETNAQKAWTALEKLKPRGSGILNSAFRKLEDVSLAACDNDPQQYAGTFMRVVTEFETLFPDVDFNENYKIYRFHSGLGSVYNSYWERYTQDHDAFDENDKPKFTLEYAITRFLNTVAHPTHSKTSAEAQALAALVNGTFAHTPQSVMALVAAERTEINIQPGANAGNSRTYVQTCKYCTHCKKDWHDDSECTNLHPHLKSRRKNNRFGG